jgi:hypothetical protein
MTDSPDMVVFPLTGIDRAPLRQRNAYSSANTNGVSTLGTGFADPNMDALRQKLNEIILKGRR